MKTNNTTTTALTANAITAKATASILASLLEDSASTIKKSTRLHEVATIPERITDETVRAAILEADARFEGSVLLSEGIQSQQNAAVLQWKKAGLTKKEASERCKTLCLAMGKSEENARCIASRAMASAGYEKDVKKAKARSSRTEKSKRTIEQALLAYAMKALKSEKKAKAALLAAAALVK